MKSYDYDTMRCPCDRVPTTFEAARSDREFGTQAPMHRRKATSVNAQGYANDPSSQHRAISTTDCTNGRERQHGRPSRRHRPLHRWPGRPRVPPTDARRAAAVDPPPAGRRRRRNGRCGRRQTGQQQRRLLRPVAAHRQQGASEHHHQRRVRAGAGRDSARAASAPATAGWRSSAPTSASRCATPSLATPSPCRR